jgi:hypothetical protein
MRKNLLPGVTIFLTCASLLLAGVMLSSWGWGWLVGEQDVALAQARATGPAPSYSVGQGSMVGKGYQLSNLAWRVSGTASGAGYILLGPATATLRGSGCCCTYLPISVRIAR